MCYFDAEKEITNVSSLYVANHFQSKDCTGIPGRVHKKREESLTGTGRGNLSTRAVLQQSKMLQ